MTVTADTITDEQLKELWLLGGNLISGRDLFIALGESVAGRLPSSEEITAARERCAAAWNTRHPVTSPTLPATRDERIALAARTIASCCEPDDQMGDGFERVLGDPELVVFEVAVPSYRRAISLSARVVKVLCDGAGFEHAAAGPHEDQGEYRCRVRVPVGDPAGREGE